MIIAIDLDFGLLGSMQGAPIAVFVFDFELMYFTYIVFWDFVTLTLLIHAY